MEAEHVIGIDFDDPCESTTALRRRSCVEVMPRVPGKFDVVRRRWIGIGGGNRNDLKWYILPDVGSGGEDDHSRSFGQCHCDRPRWSKRRGHGAGRDGAWPQSILGRVGKDQSSGRTRIVAAGVFLPTGPTWPVTGGHFPCDARR